MLDWDKPLNQQPKATQEAAARALGMGTYRPLSDADLAKIGSMTGSDFYQSLAGKRLAETARGNMPPAGYNPSADASAQLEQHGLPGIRYLDSGSRANGGTSNFVVFPGASGLLKILGVE
jgi:hypothetical protein